MQAKICTGLTFLDHWVQYDAEMLQSAETTSRRLLTDFTRRDGADRHRCCCWWWWRRWWEHARRVQQQTLNFINISSVFDAILTFCSRNLPLSTSAIRSDPITTSQWTPKLKHQKSSAVDEMAAQCCVCHFLLLNNTNITHFLPFPSYSAVVVKLSVIQW